jgi:hypothetical protein
LLADGEAPEEQSLSKVEGVDVGKLISRTLWEDFIDAFHQAKYPLVIAIIIVLIVAYQVTIGQYRIGPASGDVPVKHTWDTLVSCHTPRRVHQYASADIIACLTVCRNLFARFCRRGSSTSSTRTRCSAKPLCSCPTTMRFRSSSTPALTSTVPSSCPSCSTRECALALGLATRTMWTTPARSSSLWGICSGGLAL